MKTNLDIRLVHLLTSASLVLAIGCSAGAPPVDESTGTSASSLADAPPVYTDVTAAMTTAQLADSDLWKIQTYDLIEPYAIPSNPNGKLLVFLPGSLSQGCQYTKVIGEAAAVGYYAVGVSYPNGATQPSTPGTCPTLEVGQTLSVICGNDVHAVPGTSYDCYDQLRHNRFDGTPEPNGLDANGTTCDTSTCDLTKHPEGCFCDDYWIGRSSYKVQNPDGTTTTKYVAAEGIENRLYQLLNYLGNCDGTVGSTVDPKFCRFIDTTQQKPYYNQNLVLAGHSQGGGEAAYIAKMRVTSGVAMFSSPEDAAVQNPSTDCLLFPTARGCLVTGSADWLNDGSAFKTPLSRFYALTHEQDEFIPRIEAAWDAITSTNSTGGQSHLTDYAAACVDDTAGAASPTSIKWSAGTGGPDTAPCSNAAAATPPFSGAHRLYTNTSQVMGLVTPYHDSTAVDAQTPACPTGTHPLLMPAWRQMFIGAGNVGGTVPQTCGG